jgi:hypothetical protein
MAWDIYILSILDVGGGISDRLTYKVGSLERGQQATALNYNDTSMWGWATQGILESLHQGLCISFRPRKDTRLLLYKSTTGLIRHRIKSQITPLSWPEFRPECQQKHVGVYVRVCVHRKVLVAWPGSWPWRRHINIWKSPSRWPCMHKYGQCYVITYMNNNKLLLVNQNAPI